MTYRARLLSKWREDRLAAIKARRRHRGQAKASSTFIATTTALLRDEMNREKIAPARAGRAARKVEHPNLFGDQL